jgi:SAM-dependent methyltransferase
MSSNFPHFKAPAFLKSPVRLLLAGCGTGRELIWLQSTWNTSHILAIDLSRSSLAYAIRKARERSVDNVIDFRQADILGITGLPDPYKEFDVVCCSGVLHHMEDPMQGWQILVDKLRPGGIIKIGLYSELARRLVVQSRQRI